MIRIISEFQERYRKARSFAPRLRSLRFALIGRVITAREQFLEAELADRKAMYTKEMTAQVTREEMINKQRESEKLYYSFQLRALTEMCHRSDEELKQIKARQGTCQEDLVKWRERAWIAEAALDKLTKPKPRISFNNANKS